MALRILFIGNSHTYYNDMPAMVAAFAEKDGYDCEVTMLAHGGWYLAQHAEQEEAAFNIRYGHYDYVVLQEHSHPFGPVEKFHESVRELNGRIAAAGGKTVIYATWAKKDEPEKQGFMNEAHEQIAKEIGAPLAPVGQKWWAYAEAHPETEMYASDGAHASPEGSRFAASVIWETIVENLKLSRSNV